MKDDAQQKVVLDYRGEVRAPSVSRWASASVQVSICGLLLMLIAMTFPRPSAAAFVICVAIYFVCPILGLVFSMIGYVRDKSPRFICFVAFLVNFLQVFFMLTFAVIAALFSKS